MDSEESDGMSSVSDNGASTYWQQHHQQQPQLQQQHHHHQQQQHHSSHSHQQQQHHSSHSHQQEQPQHLHHHDHHPSQQHYLWGNNGHSHRHYQQQQQQSSPLHHQQQQQLAGHYSLGASSINNNNDVQQQQQQQHYAQQHYQQQVQLQQNGGQAPPPQLQQQHHQQQALQYHPHRATPCAERSRSRHYEPAPGDPMITSSLKGKQGKDGPDEKKDADGELWGNVEAQAAFLGPNLWDKTLPYDADLKYVDLDEFLSENGIPVDGVAGGGQAAMQASQLHKLGNSEATAGGGGGGGGGNGPNNGHQGPAGLHIEPITKRERSPSPSDCCSPDTLNPPSPADSTLSMASSGRDFDPRTRAFSDEELKPQPMIKKSRKQFVPDDLKDDKYWARRRKNNMAAKRSRDARRMKENQIALRAGFLEKENMGLRQELDRLKNENMLLRDKLSKYTDV